MRQKVETPLPKWGLIAGIKPVKWQRSLPSIVPGLMLTFSLAIVALALKLLFSFTVLSPLMMAIVLGILVRNSVSLPASCQPGITFALKRLLRLAIILLGCQLSLSQLQQVGITGFLLITITLVIAFGLTCWIGHYLKIRKKLICLIAAGTAICGASAIVATGTVLESSDEDTTYAIGIVTLFGTLSMLLYPLILPLLPLTPEAFGIWCGASIHEVAQAIAAAFQANATSGELASITKLSRVLWLIPIMVMISHLLKHKQSKTKMQTRAPMPWFVFWFVGLILLNSFNLFSSDFKATIGLINQLLLTTAMAAMGLETRFMNLQKIGLQPLYLGAIAWIIISVFSLGLVIALY